MYAFENMEVIGLELVREDVGLKEGAMLNMDTQHYSESELATLNQEVTPEIEAVLVKAVYAHAFEEISAWQKSDVRERLLDEDWEVRFDSLVSLQERMAKGMKLIQECNKVIKNANSGKRLPYKAYIAWCERRKALWSHWNGLKEECSGIVGIDSWLWGRYFELVEEEINPYFTNGEVEDVDDFALLANTIDERAADMKEAYLCEVSEYDAPESNGNGFWNLKGYLADKVEKRVSAEKDFQDAQDAFIDSLAA